MSEKELKPFVFDLIYRDGAFRIRPIPDIKVGENAWPFEGYIRCSTTPPDTEIVPKELQDLIKEAYQICVVKGMALSLIINGNQNANKDAFTFSEQKKDWGVVSNRLRSALDIITRHRSMQGEADKAQGAG